jgi:hypothetical protein
MAEAGRIDDERCDDALTLLESKRLEDGGFPAEDLNARPADGIASRASFASWGTSSVRHANPLVSLAAFRVLAQGGQARLTAHDQVGRQASRGSFWTGR